MTTHTVENQAAPRTEVDEFAANTALVEAVRTYAPAADLAELSRIGMLVGSASFQHDAALVHESTPRHSSHDRWGHRVDHVEFHPGYHRIIGEALAAGAHSAAWQATGPGANAERAARFMLFSQVEPGHGCPVSMTHSAVATLQGTPHADFWVPRLLSREYDPRLVDAAEKTP
jgi:putative acyl-CoA dehydrogenase